MYAKRITAQSGHRCIAHSGCLIPIRYAYPVLIQIDHEAPVHLDKPFPLL